MHRLGLVRSLFYDNLYRNFISVGNCVIPTRYITVTLRSIGKKRWPKVTIGAGVSVVGDGCFTAVRSWIIYRLKERFRRRSLRFLRLSGKGIIRFLFLNFLACFLVWVEQSLNKKRNETYFCFRLMSLRLLRCAFGTELQQKRGKKFAEFPESAVGQRKTESCTV